MNSGTVELRNVFECVLACTLLRCVYEGVYLALVFCEDRRTQQGVRTSQSIYGTLLSTQSKFLCDTVPGRLYNELQNQAKIITGHWARYVTFKEETDESPIKEGYLLLNLQCFTSKR